MQLAPDSRDTVFVARQAILDQSGRVFGYELLYRAAAGATSCTAAGDLAGARVLTDALLALGLDALTGGLPAFVNMTRQLLVSEASTLLAPGATVLELREDIPVDAEVTEACRRLYAKGYALALDDFCAGSDAESLLPYVKYVKVDVLLTPEAERKTLAVRLLRHGVRLVAEKVETAEVAAHAAEAGYDLFQGYYFCRPTTFSTEALPAQRLAYLNLLAAINQSDVTIGEIEDLVKRDVSLSYRVLRSINSAAFGLRQEINSIRQALIMLGIEQIRKWTSVWALAGLNTGGTPETVAVALLRARCCEILGDGMPGGFGGSEFFLLGLCSLLDTMLRRPMELAITGIPLSTGIRNALLGQENVQRAVLDAVIAYERGSWDEAADRARDAGVSASKLPAAYGDALRWARELTRSTAAVV